MLPSQGRTELRGGFDLVTPSTVAEETKVTPKTSYTVKLRHLTPPVASKRFPPEHQALPWRARPVLGLRRNILAFLIRVGAVTTLIPGEKQ